MRKERRGEVSFVKMFYFVQLSEETEKRISEDVRRYRHIRISEDMREYQKLSGDIS